MTFAANSGNCSAIIGRVDTLVQRNHYVRVVEFVRCHPLGKFIRVERRDFIARRRFSVEAIFSSCWRLLQAKNTPALPSRTVVLAARTVAGGARESAFAQTAIPIAHLAAAAHRPDREICFAVEESAFVGEGIQRAILFKVPLK